MKSVFDIYGIECGKGWEKIYKPLIDMCRKEGVEIHQIKEKFGALRFYVGRASKQIHVAINAAEKLSSETCERCGDKGKRRDGGWIKTLCDTCAKAK